MASTLNPYLSFRDTAREAMEFYRSVLGGDLTLDTFGQYGAEGPDADKIMHGRLSTDLGFVLMAADTPAEMPYHAGDNVTISLSGDDAEELRGYWGQLSADGSVSVPLEKQMWGDEFGALTDKFGIPWMVNITGAAEPAA